MAKKPEEFAEFAPDGVTRLFNPNKPHGTVYADGFHEGKWAQDGVIYRADRFPVGYAAPAETTGLASVIEADKPMHWKTRKKLEEAQNAGASGAP